MSMIPCRVCSKPYDGTTHCSVTACRNCAMFLKRNAGLANELRCTTGKNDCRLDKAGRIECSSCRYKKCIEVGLILKENRRSTQQMQLKTTHKDDKTITLDHVLNIVQAIHLLLPKMDYMPTLKHFCLCFSQTSNSKTRNELTLLKESGAELIRFNGKRPMGKITHAFSLQLTQYNLSAFKSLLDKTFPSFSTVDEAFRDNLVNLLMFPMFELSSSYKTYRTFNDINSTKFICTEALYGDLNDMTGFMNPEDFDDYMDYTAVLHYLKLWWQRYKDTTHRYMHTMKITDVEYLGVVALTIFNEDYYEQSGELGKAAAEQRRLIYNDLDYYYKNILHMDNYVERVAAFTELNRIIRTNLFSLRETFLCLKTFNYYKGNEGLWEATERILASSEALFGPSYDNAANFLQKSS